MIADLKQPAKNWIADNLNNFQTLINNGDDPSMDLNIGGCVIQIRLMKVPGLYERLEINIGGSEE